MDVGVVVGAVGKRVFLVARVEHGHDAPVLARGGCEEGAQVQRLVPRVQAMLEEQLAVRAVGGEIEGGEPTARFRIALVHQLDEVVVARLVERGREQGRDAI